MSALIFYNGTTAPNYVKSVKDLATEKIRTFERFGDGWNFGDGISFSESTIKNAREVVEMLKALGQTIIDAFPSPDGTIRVTIYPEERYIAINVIENSFEVSIEDRSHQVLHSFSTSSIFELQKIMEI